MLTGSEQPAKTDACRLCGTRPLDPEQGNLETLCREAQADYEVGFYPMCDCWAGVYVDAGISDVVLVRMRWDPAKNWVLALEPEKPYWESLMTAHQRLIEDKPALKCWVEIMVERKKPQ